MYDFLSNLKNKNINSTIDDKFALIVHSTNNIGDDIQSIAALQFLPRVDYFVDRDFIGLYKIPQRVKIIMNGWFLHKFENWPPAKNLYPLFISFHISQKSVDKIVKSRSSVKFLKKFSPIGCRDMHTKSLLDKIDVPAYFSGCLTLTLGYKMKGNIQRSNEVLIVDLDEGAIPYIPEEILKKSKFRTNTIFLDSSRSRFIETLKLIIKKSPKIKSWLKDVNLEIKSVRSKILRLFSPLKPLENLDEHRFKRFELANERLNEIANAQLVITSRLHVALPALAFGTPVIFVHKNIQDPRFSGFLKFLNHYDLETFSKVSKKIPWDNVVNPNKDELNLLREKLIKTCEEFINK
ncbi:MAG: hypothetical protein PWP54_1508 [Thermosipho sp. (in: thermotogales)]|jgi:hypothetical protein|nr:hypothetical protein [Thermosipho sp. (in: thermotogales)]MDN5325253.1 hypothetical protein [Thermosipho sp. (in: thermotogales)]